MNFAREEFEKSFDYISDRCVIKRKSPDDKPLIYTTGVGGTQFMGAIQDKFRVRCVHKVLKCTYCTHVYQLVRHCTLVTSSCFASRTENLTEMDMFIASHNYFVKTFTKGEQLFPHDMEATKVDT